MRRQGQDRRMGLGLMLLLYQLFSSNEYIPPVTLATVVAQVAVFLGFVPALDIRRVGHVCLSPNAIWHGEEWKRLLTATVVHADDWHLYYNMISFLWKGRKLERRFGSVKFAVILVVLTLLTSMAHVLLSVVLGEKLGVAGGQGLMYECAVGFSGVIFALKVLVNHYLPMGDQWIMGLFPVPSKYACWAELVIIQFLVPRASFVGHLAGIIVGLLYLYSPLSYVIDALVPENFNFNQFANGGYYGGQQHYTTPRASNSGRFWGAGSWGSSSGRTAYTNPPPSAPPMDNQYAPPPYPSGSTEDDQLAEALRRSREEHDAAYSNRWRDNNSRRSGRLYPEL